MLENTNVCDNNEGTDPEINENWADRTRQTSLASRLTLQQDYMRVKLSGGCKYLGWTLNSHRPGSNYFFL